MFPGDKLVHAMNEVAKRTEIITMQGGVSEQYSSDCSTRTKHFGGNLVLAGQAGNDAIFPKQLRT